MFKKLLTYSILSLVGMMGFLGVFIENNNIGAGDSHYIVSIGEETFADDCSGPNPPTPCLSAGNAQNAEMQKMLNSLVGGLNIILDILTIIVSPAIMLASWLMSPDWTSGDLFGIRPALHSLWVTVSNVVYFIYAILLIFIALATIFNSQNYGYKQLLPKLALGVILVPLTWWFVQFTISLSTYITASVISIPMETLAKYSQPGSFWNTESIPKKIIYENSKVLNEDSKEIDKDTVLCKDKGRCVSPETFIKTSGGMYSPLLIYSFSVFKFHEVKKLKSGSDVVYAIGDIIHQGIIGVIMFIVYGLLVIALIFMLLMRAVKLWFYAIFSPLFTIKYVLGDKGFGDADKDGSFKITEFIGLAFVPAVVSLALSFGLIIISVMHAGGTNSGSASANSKCVGGECTLTIMGTNSIVSTTTGEGTNKKSVTTVNIGGDKDDNRISYEFKGSVQGGEPILGSVTSALGSTGNLFGTIILDIIALIFIWIAFMAGKGVSKAAGKAIEPFEQMGNKIGSLGASLPKYAPIPGVGVSMSGMEKVVDKGKYMVEQQHDKKLAESSLGKMVGYGDAVQVADKKRMDDYTKAGLQNADAMKGAVQLMQSNANKTNFDSDPMAKTFMEGLKKDYNGNQVQMENALITKGGLDAKNAKIIAEEINKGNIDMKNNKILKDAWKDTVSKSGTGGGATGTGFTGSGAGTNTIILKFNDTTMVAEKGKTNDETEKNIIKGLNTELKTLEEKGIKIDKETLSRMLKETGIKSEDAGPIAEKILADSRFAKIKKDETKK